MKSPYPSYLSRLIDEGHRLRNQIATLSGLTNTYIRNLERGEIVNVPRERLISIGVALNLDLNELENLLAAFDRAKLTIQDIPLFLASADHCKVSEAVLAFRDLFSYELIMLSVEKRYGHQAIVSDRPTMSLLVSGHRSYTDRNILPFHPIYSELIEAIGNARRQNFFDLAEKVRIEHCICSQCLIDYLRHCPDDREKEFRLKHVTNLLQVVRHYQKLRLYLSDSCVNFNFTLKAMRESGQGLDKLAYSARAPHDIHREKQGRIFGFVTENPSLSQNFQAELTRIKTSTPDFLLEREQQIQFLTDLLGNEGYNRREISEQSRAMNELTEKTC